MSDVVRVSVVGDFHVSLPDGRTASFRTRRAAEIVAKLCLASSRRLLRSDLAADIWPDADRSTRLRNLRPALNYARAALEIPDAIVADEDWLILSDVIDSDWLELSRLETRIQRAEGGDDRLVLLYSLNGLIQKPLLANWDCEWLEDIRVHHDQRRLNSLRQLGEELGSRGEWKPALDYARRIADLDPTSEDGIRLQLRCLAELERPREAQREFALYAKNLDAILGLPVNPSLRRFAEEVIAGRFPRAGSRPLTAVQQEMISEMMGVLVDEEPERLLPLLASPKLNWSLVFYGSEIRPILERVLQATTGWSTERCGAMKRLLQVYTQEMDWPKQTALAHELYESPKDVDKIASLNFQAIERKESQDYPAALELFDRAAKLAEVTGERYLGAVTTANRAILNIAFEVYGLGLEELKQAQDRLAERTEPNARFGTSLAKSWGIVAAIGKSDIPEAKRAAEDWRLFAETNGTLAYDSLGKLYYGATLAAAGNRGARDWFLSGIDTAFLSRDRGVLLESVYPIVYGLNALRLQREAATAARDIKHIATQQKYRVAPIHRRILAAPPASEARPERMATVAEVLGYCRAKLLGVS